MTPPDLVILRHRLNHGPSALLTETSHNRKLSPVRYYPRPGQRDGMRAVSPHVSSTFASIEATCPDTCQFKRTSERPGGCFADAGLTRLTSIRLNRAARTLGPHDVIAEECREIDRAFGGARIPQDGMEGGRDLRIHVGGDAPDRASAAALGAAATRWRARGGGRVWSYTHAWRFIPRAAWGRDVSVLASCDTPDDMITARDQGYAPAIVVVEHPADGKTWRMRHGHDWRVIPCPAETRKTNCAQCRLCLGGVDLYRMRAVIAFAVHGQHAEAAASGAMEAPGVAGPPPIVPRFELRYTCGACGRKGHNRRTCTASAPGVTGARREGRGRNQCGVCHQEGHNARRHRGAA